MRRHWWSLSCMKGLPVCVYALVAGRLSVAGPLGRAAGDGGGVAAEAGEGAADDETFRAVGA